MPSERTFALGYNFSRSCLRLIFKECKAAAGLVVLCLLSALPGLGQTTWTVSSLGDNAGDPTTLRGAIAAAAAGDTIDFSVTGTITLTGGELGINKNLTITGPGSSSLTVSGNFVSRIFAIGFLKTVNISGLTIRDGVASHGGAIYNIGTLTLISTIISGNVAGLLGGGGIYTSSGTNSGDTLTLIDSMVIGNSTGANGGGVFNGSFGTVNVINSLVSNNRSTGGGGGGIYSNDSSTRLTVSNSTISANSSVFGSTGIFNGGTLTLTNSTVHGNTSSLSPGGGIGSVGVATIINSTVSGNSSTPQGGGGIAYSGMLTLINTTIHGNAGGSNGGGILSGTTSTLRIKNTIVANSLSGGNCAGTGTKTSDGHNLSDDSTCSSFLTATGDLNNTPAGLDPAGLQNNGGPTETIALLVGSAALDAIPAADCTNTAGKPILIDQRGVSRPQGTACDVGAFELGPTDPVGPITSNVLGDQNPASLNQAIALSANIDDTTTGGANISLADFEIRDGDGNVVHSGTGDNDVCPSPQNLCPVDEFGNPESSSAFDAVMENVEVTIPAGTLTPGVYNACVRGTDANGNTGEFECAYLVVYDPNGGFVTGGGWIESHPGFCSLSVLCAGAGGKANFGFVSKYPKGAKIPTGQTQFEFKAGNLNFHSVAYEWLVVSGPMAQYKGAGTINGAGDYGFLLTAKDSAINGGPPKDTFRIKIWDKATETTVYDNGSDHPIGGGSIVIHKK